MLYTCDVCNYKTERANNLVIHNKSKKHLKNAGINTNFVCENCGKEYKQKASLYKHKKHDNCKPKNKLLDANVGKDNKNNNDHDKLLNILEEKDNIIEEKDKIIKIMSDRERESFVNALKEKDKIIQETKNEVKLKERAIKYIAGQYVDSNKNYQQTFNFVAKTFVPPVIGLEQPLDYNVLHDKKNKLKLFETLAYEYEKKNLVHYFSDRLVDFYKTDDYKTCCVYTTDVERATFMITVYDEIYDPDSNQERITKWKKDKRGLIFGKMSLGKLFEFLCDYLKKIIEENHETVTKMTNKIGAQNCDKLIKATTTASDIRKKMLDPQFTQQIIHNASPRFVFNREDYEDKLLTYG
ncbi:MAG: hypothetical protein Edafosvirus9_21 [Edafosvirus sp.]|uniref:C2H2-type domain-containing protein n=1 Tax=Edafosvirus sp. TaxID=2487765 RepID=A0A3G4ZTT6_9VIRU|nr:MAG: hypothetical protein Edafosvirus9_21 [Edafosvirus sp.]